MEQAGLEAGCEIAELSGNYEALIDKEIVLETLRIVNGVDA